jgi:hypothetical protein
MTAPAHRTTLRHRYARQVALIAALLLACAALIEGAFGFRQAREQMASRQAVLARAAANEIEAYLDNVAAGLRQVQALPWGTDGFGDDRRREELHRLLALHPALIEVRDLDARGQERLFVSRTALDRRGGAAPSAPGTGNGPALGYGAPRFDDEGVPNVARAHRRGRRHARHHQPALSGRGGVEFAHRRWQPHLRRRCRRFVDRPPRTHARTEADDGANPRAGGRDAPSVGATSRRQRRGSDLRHRHRRPWPHW